MDLNNFNRVYIQSKIAGKYVDSENDPANLLRKASSDKKLKKSEDIIYCAYKTKYKDKDGEEKDAVIMAFSMELTGRAKGSISPVMKLVDFIQRTLIKIDFIKYTRDPIIGTKNNIAFVKVIKIIREDDLL